VISYFSYVVQYSNSDMQATSATTYGGACWLLIQEILLNYEKIELRHGYLCTGYLYSSGSWF